ncbi:envoplakin [Protopterus annectens]|uniref:envoplakin n=1 Tax=Protopterus annectens TaxID=7888 RepID=UPI001CFA77F4|nr:envoplakin [Protopterus annectens]
MSLFRINKSSPSKTLTLGSKPNKTQAPDLVQLISRMQSSADLVEKSIIDTEEKLKLDTNNYNSKKPFQYQKRNADNLRNAEDRLKELFLDTDKAKKLKHPQAEEIERDIKQLHERWVSQCAEYRDLYDKLNIPKTGGTIVDWPRLFEQKQREINKGTYGPALPDVEKQVAQHNILHKEIDEYGPQIEKSTVKPEQLAAIQSQYKDLWESSRSRKIYLGSLYDYMQGCTRELMALNDESNKIVQQDWSDQMADHEEARRRYEHFKTYELMNKESTINKLQSNGDELIQLQHPAAQTVQAHQDAVKNEWQEFLNLCLCQENHLKNVEDYKKFHDDADIVSKSLKKINTDLDNKYKSYNRDNHRVMSDLLLQLENDERALLQNEKDLADLKKRSTQISPLKMRRNRTSKPITVEAICDWEDESTDIARGEKYSLKDNSDNDKWVVQSNTGVLKSVPGVCFNIPPPDPEAISSIDKLSNDLAEAKVKHQKVRTDLKNSYDEVNRLARPVLVQNTASQKEDPKGLELLKKVDKINADLNQTENDILNRMRVPINRNAPSKDLSSRLSDHEGTVRTLQKIGTEKDALQKECEKYLSSKPSGVTAAQLPSALSDMKNKYNDVTALSKLYQDKGKSALNLENQIKKTDSIITSFENELAQENSIPASSNVLQDRIKELQKMKRDLENKQDNLQQLNENFSDTEQCCSALHTNFQEFCPDLPKQETEVRRLNDRFNAVAEQLNEREQKLQNADIAYQRFKSSNQDLNTWINSLPNNQLSANDGLSQVNYKLQSQKKVVDEIKRKEHDKDSLVDLSHDLQTTLNDYDLCTDKYRTSLDPSLSASSAKKSRTSSLQDNIINQEKVLVKQYTEAAAANQSQLSQLEFAKNVLEQQEDQVSNVVVQRNVHTENVQSKARETELLKQQMEEEKRKINDVQVTLDENRRKLLLLRSQRPVEKFEEKEVVQYYRDPKLESEVASLKTKIESEYKRKANTQAEIQALNNKILLFENERKAVKPQLITKEVTQIEKDPLLDKEAANLRTEINRLKNENAVSFKEFEHLQTDVTILEQKKPNIKERVVVKEVVKVQKDPQMLQSARTLQSQIDDEIRKRRTLEESTITLRNRILEVERQISLAEPKVIVKEVKKVEQDPVLLQEAGKLKSLLDEERHKSSLLSREITDLRTRYNIIENQKQKIEIKEVISELFHIAPETEMEITNIRRELQMSSEKKSLLDKEIDKIRKELEELRSQKPRVEQKEVVQEVVKLESSPEILKEIDRLKLQQTQITDSWNRCHEQVLRLRNERDEWKRERAKVETKLVNKELVKYENDPMLEKEAERLRKEVREESQRRRETEETVFTLQNKYLLLERKKPEEKVVIQEVVRLQKDPSLLAEHNRLNKSLDEEVRKRRNLEREVQQLRVLVEDKENILDLEGERMKKLAVEQELRLVRTRIKDLEDSPAPVEEQIVRENVVKVEREPKLERIIENLRTEYNNEKNRILDLERECRNLQIRIDILEKEKSQEKTIYKEVIRVEKDRVLESERNQLRDILNKEKIGVHDAEQEIRRLNQRINRIDDTFKNYKREEADLNKEKERILWEKTNIERDLKELERQKQNVAIHFMEESKLRSEKSEKDKQRRQQLLTEISLLESDILKEKDIIYQKENAARELHLACSKEDSGQTDMQMRETNLSTKISILDPDTGKDMSPYEAYRRGLIDRNQYTQLQELECDWEEITTLGPDGETTVLRDKKSGKQYSIDNALRDRRVTKEEYQMYKNGKIPISEFALLVAGEQKPSSFSFGFSSPRSPLSSPTTQRRQNFFDQSSAATPSDDTYPIAGIHDSTTNTRCSVRSALLKKMIDPVTAQKLLEAQAATGGIVDISTKERYSVHKASEKGLVDSTLMKRLINAQKAFTGVEDPVTKQRLSVGEAIQKGWMPQDNALHYLQAQYLTGGLVDPNKAGRVDIDNAVKRGMIDKETARIIKEESNYVPDITDPVSKQKINYKDAMSRCVKDNKTGLLYLPAASSSQQSSYMRSFVR